MLHKNYRIWLVHEFDLYTNKVLLNFILQKRNFLNYTHVFDLELPLFVLVFLRVLEYIVIT